MPLKNRRCFNRMVFRLLPPIKAGFVDGQQAESAKLIQIALEAAALLRYANPEKKAPSSQHVNGENVIMPVNTKSPANVLKADANGVKRNEKSR
jgi:hypothetical protein